MTYQEIFNRHLKSVRLICNATGQQALADTVIGVMFDLSDELKKNNLIKGDTDNDKKNVTREYNNFR
jgi:hypothetical protein